MRVLALAALALLLRFVVIPQFVDAGHDLHAIQHLSPWPLLLGLVLELASLAAYGALTFTVLDPRDRPTFGTVTRVDLAGVATTNVVPAGERSRSRCATGCWRGPAARPAPSSAGSPSR